MKNISPNKTKMNPLLTTKEKMSKPDLRRIYTPLTVEEEIEEHIYTPWWLKVCLLYFGVLSNFRRHC